MSQIDIQRIYFKDRNNNNHYVADLIQEIEPPDIFYIVRYKDNIEELERYKEFSEISGCPYRVKKEYKYVNTKPWFMIERLPNYKRVDLGSILKDWGMTHYNMWEAIRITHGVSINDRLFVDDSYPTSNYNNTFYEY